MATPTFSGTLGVLITALHNLHDQGTHTEQVELCRTLDAFLLPRAHALQQVAAMPAREPLAITLGLPPAQANAPFYCIACGKHHAAHHECPYDSATH